MNRIKWLTTYIAYFEIVELTFQWHYDDFQKIFNVFICMFQEEKKCFLCEKLPKEGSIYCSDECIIKHATKAVDINKKNRPKGSTNKAPIMVIDPLVNSVINGPAAPTEENLQSWLLAHPTFHVVLANNDQRSKFYGTNTTKFYG